MFEKSPTSNHMCTHTYFMAHTYIDLDFEYFLSVVVVIAEHIANLTSQMISSHSIVGGSFRLVVLASTARVLRCTPGWRLGCTMGSPCVMQLTQDFP